MKDPNLPNLDTATERLESIPGVANVGTKVHHMRCLAMTRLGPAQQNCLNVGSTVYRLLTRNRIIDRQIVSRAHGIPLPAVCSLSRVVMNGGVALYATCCYLSGADLEMEAKQVVLSSSS